MRKDRLISLAIALVCAGTFYVSLTLHPRDNTSRGSAGIMFLPLIFLFPLALIWFGDEFGAYTGPVSRGYITEKSPGCLVKLMGWLFLLAIAGVFIYGAIAS